MFGFGMEGQRVAYSGNGLAIDQHIGGTGNHRRGREIFVIGAKVSEQNYRFTHVASFAFFRAILALWL
ncbi:hypothetical protein A8B84_11010 [Marinobacter sp. EhC06]|nr:hypothetical protein A8B84_11010 [Marinobacter sp. EhC06]OAN94078.1 hypothetical protein A8B80_16640 [Marinobacter sp. EhN04]